MYAMISSGLRTILRSKKKKKKETKSNSNALVGIVAVVVLGSPEGNCV